MNEKLNVETTTTAAESLFSNGIVERHNLIPAMQKTLLDVECEPQIALAWAVSAKNVLQNHGGSRPNQLVSKISVSRDGLRFMPKSRSIRFHIDNFILNDRTRQ